MSRRAKSAPRRRPRDDFSDDDDDDDEDDYRSNRRGGRTRRGSDGGRSRADSKPRGRGRAKSVVNEDGGVFKVHM